VLRRREGILSKRGEIRTSGVNEAPWDSKNRTRSMSNLRRAKVSGGLYFVFKFAPTIKKLELQKNQKS
jgi:hypothetical protein